MQVSVQQHNLCSSTKPRLIIWAELETRILHLQPAELLLEENISQASEGMLKYLVNQGLV